jgi:phosphatidylglycerophosphate synthase
MKRTVGGRRVWWLLNTFSILRHVYMLSFAAYWAPLVTALVFIGAAITDAVDGYLARKVHSLSAEGRHAAAALC